MRDVYRNMMLGEAGAVDQMSLDRRTYQVAAQQMGNLLLLVDRPCKKK